MKNEKNSIKVVIDTNILVSAFWSENSKIYNIIRLVLSDEVVVCYSAEIMREYKAVLGRPKFSFRFSSDKVEDVLEKITADGICVAVKPSTVALPDEDDRCFYDVAVSCNAILITGNTKHFPGKMSAMTPARFLSDIE